MTINNFDIAVIGMACRFPGAADVEKYWDNLKDGIESIQTVTEKELKESNIDEKIFTRPNYVKAAATLDNIEMFDANFFGYSAREAAIIDPQQRIFLELVWQAIEDGGYDLEAYPGAVGIFAGSSFNQYLLNNIFCGRKLTVNSDGFLVQISNDKDNLATRIAYKLNLKGPAISVQTACSTSLVAIHLACQSLLNYDCDMALAGGVTVKVPQKCGYFYEKDMILSPDGHCRPFDEKAQGTVFGSGAGVVLLKRLEEAEKDGDHILAVIKGSAINNDGSNKVGFTAPSALGQKEVISKALAFADVPVETITAIEAHGTGTILGDPIEFQALNEIFEGKAIEKNSIAIGSVKSNLGHLENAAGIASFIKMVLCLQHQCLVPSIHFQKANPHLGLEDSPFYVNTSYKKWEHQSNQPLRCGISSFGIGGTNAHVIVEEYLGPEKTVRPSRSVQLMNISAKTPETLNKVAQNLAAYLHEANSADLADIAYTQKMGRHPLNYRRIAVCRDKEYANHILEEPESINVNWIGKAMEDPKTVFMFPGQGSQYINMAREIYDQEPLFRKEIDHCAEILKKYLHLDIRELIFNDDNELNNQRLNNTQIAQPAVFIIAFSMAKLWMAWGVKPQAMIGHSIGEYVAACLGGVFSLEDALLIISQRALLMSQMPQGVMTAVTLTETAIRPLLTERISIAAINGPALTVVSGPQEAMTEFLSVLDEKNIFYRHLHTSHAFHSQMMQPMVQPFLEVLKKCQFHDPQLPYISNVTGTWITSDQATSPEYWAEHILQPVQCSAAFTTLLKENLEVFLEVGPGTTMSSLGRIHDKKKPMINSLPHAKDQTSSMEMLMSSLGRLWIAGINIDWAGFYQEEKRCRVNLPVYPFARRHYWIESSESASHPDIAEFEIALPLDFEDHIAEEVAATYVAPQTESQEKLVDIFQDVLGTGQIGIFDNFFDLGGHSLLATQLLTKINACFQVNVQLNDFFKCPTVESLSRLMADQDVVLQKTGVNYDLPQVVTDLEHRYDPFPLTEMQEAQWLGRATGAFNIGNVAAHLYVEMERENLDIERLKQSWQGMIDRHESLHMIFLPEGKQKILKDIAPYNMKNLDLREETPEVVEAKILSIRNELGHIVRPVDTWPLFEVRTTQLPGNKVRIHFSIDLLICDVGSFRLLIHEWALLYKNAQMPLPKLDLSFRDYVLAEKKIKDTAMYEKANMYWDQRVIQLPSMPLLPLAKNPSLIKKPIFKRISNLIDIETWQRLKNMGISKRLSPSIVILTAFGKILAKWSKTPHFCINTPIINRMPIHPQYGDIIGEFSSFAPVEVNAVPDLSFEDLAHHVQECNWSNLENRFVSGTSILRKLAQYKGEVAGAVFPVVFTSTIVQKVEGESETFDQLGKFVYVISQTPQVWLDHTVLEEENGLMLSWHYIDDLFPKGMIETMWGAYQDLLYRLANDESFWSRGYYDLLPEDQKEERRLINNTAAEIPDKLLQEPFFEQAAQNPNLIAVISENVQISYGKLADWANRLGGKLRKMGVKPGELVGLVMEKDWQQIVSVMGVLQAGGAYLPVSADLPKERLHYILNNGNTRFVLIQEQYAQSVDWPDGVEKVIVSETMLNELEPCQLPKVQSPNDLAYVIYTSGSTGLPKGVMLSHQSAQNTITDINRRFKVNQADRAFAISELNFDLSVYDIFGMLSVGGGIVLPKSHTKDPQYWLELASKNRVTIWNSVPALMEMVLEYWETNPIGLPLRLVLLSGDWIPVNLPVRLRKMLDNVEIISLGGATEGSIWSIFYPIQHVDPDWSSIPYGKPLMNQEFYVLNENLEHCPYWVTGDLYIGGAGVAMGYLNNQELTDKSFIIHPYMKKRLYRTGDLGRYLPDGNIEFLGREDFQVKISGFRIELGEIEAILNQHPAIKSSIVIAQGKNGDKRHLIGYVLFKDGAKAEAPEIQEYLKSKLPEYMIPSQFVILDSFPLTANGKVERNLLPKPSHEQTTKSHTEPNSVLISKLVPIFAEVMGVEREKIDIYANFFSMGGDSIMGIQVVTKASKEGIEILPQQLFENPTIAELCNVLEPNYTHRPLDDVNGQHFQGTIPLTPVQNWLLELTGYSVKNSNWGLFVQLFQEIDPKLLETAYRYLVGQCDVLQLHYIWKNEWWEQEYETSEKSAELDFVDITNLTEAEFEKTVAKIWDELEYMQDAVESPFVKLCLFHDRQKQNQYLLVIANQLIMDYRSLELFLNHLFAAYQRLKDNNSVNLEFCPLHFKEWAQQLVERGQSMRLTSKEEELWSLLPKQMQIMNFGVPDLTLNQDSSLIVTVNEPIIQDLLNRVLQTIRMTPEEFLITVLAVSLTKEQRMDSVYIDWLAQPSVKLLREWGIEKLIANLNWPFPILLKPDIHKKPEIIINNVKEHLRNFKNHGENYGFLRYLQKDLQFEEIIQIEKPAIRFGFNHFDPSRINSWKRLKVKTPQMQKNKQNAYLLEIDAFLSGRELNMIWNFDSKKCSFEAIQKLTTAYVRELRNLIQYFRNFDGVVMSPCDFPDADINQEDLEKLLAIL